ncbi:MAG: flagellar hook-basal body complex protein [Planctomycetales bacterium]|nr:flagellar hook-basal body complex protein [Planctomycetales bacterium]
MLSGLYSTANSLLAFQTSLDTSSNNLANVNTTAFKRSTVSFQDLMYAGPTSQQVGNGVQVAATSRDFKEGPAVNTGNQLDLLIDGNGFFAIQMPNGQLQYTRDGALHSDGFGRLVTDEGFRVQPPITFPSDTLSIDVTTDGVVSALTASSPVVPIVVGQLQLSRFINPPGLRSETGNRFSETSESGPPNTGFPGANALGMIQQNYLEQSNVDVASEMIQLTSTTRSYQVNARALQTENRLLQSALDLITT